MPAKGVFVHWNVGEVKLVQPVGPILGGASVCQLDFGFEELNKKGDDAGSSHERCLVRAGLLADTSSDLPEPQNIFLSETFFRTASTQINPRQF
jgi:hypothetical protein